MKVEEAIKELSDDFSKNKGHFFNEHDFHHKFFNIVYKKIGNRVHPEYPTVKRFKRIPPKVVEEEGKRGHYDFVVLNQKFYDKNKNNFDKISNKKVGINDNEGGYIDNAIEFKYFTKNKISENEINEIKFDIFKLENADEASKKILVIFSLADFSDRINDLVNGGEVIVYFNGGKIVRF